MNDKTKSTVKDKPSSNKAPAPAKKAIAKKPVDKPVKQKTGSGIGWLAIILVLIAAGAGFFGFQQLEQKINELSNGANTAETNISDLSQGITSNAEHLGTKAQHLSEQLVALQQQSNEKFTLLQKQVGKNKRQWLIAEAEYLTSVANTRLLLADDVATAISALQAADQRLKENGDPITYPIRKQLAKEIIELKSTKLPDIVGISSQLSALEGAVSQMEIIEPHAGTAQAPAIGKGDVSPIPENIQDTLDEAWANFSKLVVVRRNDEPMAALMTPERVELIRKNLALKLETARLALVNKNQALYTASITMTIEWLADYFDAENPAVKAALEQLHTLEGTSIEAKLPSIALSLKMLRNLPILSITEQAYASPVSIKQTVKKAVKDISKTVQPTVDPKPSVNAKAIEQPSDLKL